VNQLRRHLETTIHDPRIMEPAEDELEDMAPSDAEDLLTDPYPEGDATVNDSTLAPYLVAPNESSLHTPGYAAPVHPATPSLPPSQQLDRMQASTGTSRSRPERSRQNGNGSYTTPPEMEHLDTWYWVASSTTQDAGGSWQNPIYGHSEVPHGEWKVIDLAIV
jgi:hypothetical protein